VSGIGRRAFFTRSAAVIGAGVGVGVAELRPAGESDAAAEAPVIGPSAQWRLGQQQLAEQTPFTGAHQAGVVSTKPAQATFVALDSVAGDQKTLLQALEVLSHRSQELAAGGPIPVMEVEAPPADSGTLGPTNAPDSLAVTIGFGASLFDRRYGLGHLRPRALTAMPTFPVDDLDPAQTHGDVLLQIEANQRDTVVHTVREITRTVRGALQLRWMIDGFSSAPRGPSPHSNRRNLFAFRDGTANPDVNDRALMNRLVWTGSEEPSWAVGGTYQVVRIIRMQVEFWDRVGLREQEGMIGRVRSSGAPLGGTNEFEDPRYDLDPHGNRVPLDAHIRLGNPRTAATADERILRRGFNYSRGFDAAGQLDQGLVFVAFNRDPERQFATVQRRLNDEPMIDYISPVGGGYFFVPPAARNGSDWVGSGLQTGVCSAGAKPFLKCEE
jgi:deferrochelatase/peroxidase EfeB